MKRQIHWEHSFLSSLTTIKEGSQKIGEINKSPFSSSGKASLDNTQLEFKSKSFTEEGLLFIRPQDAQEIGKLNINTLNSNAEFIYKDGRVFHFKSKDLGFSGGVWYEGDRVLATISSGSFKGKIELYDLDEELNLILISAGLHTNSYLIGLVVLALFLIYFIFFK